MIGRTLNHYEILEPLGAGGMGEVYRAHDSTLKRDVAIKVLPEDLSADVERLARLEREAQLLAALNHPNIEVIHGLEEAEAEGAAGASIRFMVLELIEGENLAEMLLRGRIEVERALGIARQIAEALEAAHAKGIIHRDLKPGNVVITPTGQAKVLDFGLAKSHESEGASPGVTPDITESPTVAAATRAGIILGTAAYMSPEQARGKPLDKRTDIWSFGCVLYEMLSGCKPFEGETVTDVLAAIVEREPDWSALPEELPPVIRLLLPKCLEKDPHRRLHDIADARIDIVSSINEPEVGGALSGAAQVATQPPLWRRAIPWGLATLLVVTTAIAIWSLTRPATPARPMHLALRLPEEMKLGESESESDTAAMSPDGTHLVYMARSGLRPRSLYLQAIGALQPRLIPFTEGAMCPFFSPDGQWVGYAQGGTLYKVSLGGGQPIPLVNAGWCLGAGWGPDGSLFFVRDFNAGISRLSEDASETEIITSPDRDNGELGHYDLQVLPGGNEVLFTVATAANFNRSRIAVYSLETGRQKYVHEGGFRARYVPTGHLVYAQNDTLMAVPFDLDRLEVTDTPVTIVDGVRASFSEGFADFSFSADGSLVYVTGGSVNWVGERVDLQGRSEPLMQGESFGGSIAHLSPDGERLAMGGEGDDQDIWIADLTRDTSPSRITTDPNYDDYPIWTPDGEWVTFISDRMGDLDLWHKRADGRGDAELLVDTEYVSAARAWSPDGRRLAYVQRHPDTGWDIWIFDAENPDSLEPFLATEFDEDMPVFSPDGQWIAYYSNRDGPFEIYVAPYPFVGAARKISVGGGRRPRWPRNGNAIYYVNDGKMQAVPVELFPQLEIGPSMTLPDFPDLEYWAWDAFPDGQSFLVLKQEETAPLQLNLVLNWFEELKERVPTGH